MICVNFNRRNDGSVYVSVSTDWQNDPYTVEPPLPPGGRLASTAETITVVSGARYAHVGYKYIPSCRLAYPQVLDGDLPVELHQNGGPVRESIAEKSALYATGAL